MRVRFSVPFQTSPGAHPASYTIHTRSFLGLKRPGRGVDHPPPSSAEIQEKVELYLYSPPPWAFVFCSRLNFTFYTHSCEVPSTLFVHNLQILKNSYDRRSAYVVGNYGIVLSTGGGGLEVYGDGPGSPLLMDLHSCLRPWYGAHYSAGAVTLRHDASHRHSVFQDREEENEDDDGSRRGLKIPDTERNIVTRSFIKSEVRDCSGTEYTDSLHELARTLNQSSILYYFLMSVTDVVGKMKCVVYFRQKQIL